MSEYGTHMPCIEAALSAYDAFLVVELGIGNYSTPVILKHKKNIYIGVEQNLEWFKEISKKYELINNEFILFYSEGITAGSRIHEVSSTDKLNIHNEYLRLKEKIKDLCKRKSENEITLLFVDQFNCCRNLSIEILHECFDIIIIHDTEPAAIPWYGYDFSPLRVGYTEITFKTSMVWTSVFVRNDKMRENFINLCEVAAKKYDEDTNFAQGKTIVMLGR